VLNGREGGLEDSVSWGIVAQGELQWLDVRRGVSTRAARTEDAYEDGGGGEQGVPSWTTR
jgi:hypothetical protein